MQAALTPVARGGNLPLMQAVVTGARMREIDRETIEQTGIPGIQLMEAAGRAVAEHAWQALSARAGRRVTVASGPGNNGGDGFVTARHLAALGAHCEVFLLGGLDRLKGDALANARRLEEAGLPLVPLDDAGPLVESLRAADLAIDALLGTGLASVPRGLVAAAIRALNDSPVPVLSIDLPSGADADTGAAFDPAVRAGRTVALALPKYGNLIHPAAGLNGKVLVADIGIPADIANRGADTWLLDELHVRALLPPRPADGHKGTFGTCLLVAGAPGYTGAACLAGGAAVRAGAGLVKLAVPAPVLPVVESVLLEAVKLGLPATDRGTLGRAAHEPLLEAARSCRAAAIGPGLTTEPETAETVRELIRLLDLPLVIDADGINALAGHPELLRGRKSPTVVTPHPGELARLLGTTAAEINRGRVESCRGFARDHGVFCALKGAPTVTADPAGRCYLNPTGNSGLGSGGTGDVLTGLVLGLLCQGSEPLDALAAAVFLHGRAADLAARELTEYSLAAGDLVDWLPRAFRSLLETAAG